MFVSNVISRLIGSFIRFFLILTGLASEVFLVAMGCLLFIFWIFLPLLIIFGFDYGFRILF